MTNIAMTIMYMYECPMNVCKYDQPRPYNVNCKGPGDARGKVRLRCCQGNGVEHR